MVRILGDYTIIKQIGQGSLGAVYLAEHRFMKRQYALKLLPDELASDRGFIQRFEEEVGALATLDHPNIVKIHNISSSQGQYFLVTDCIVDELGESTNLNEYLSLREKILSEEELLEILTQVAEALDYAHDSQRVGGAVVHRGLKLNNLLVGSGQGKIKVTLSDFGLSKIVGTGAVLSRTYKTLAEALGVTPVVEGGANAQDRYSSKSADANKLGILHASFLQNFSFLSPEQKRQGDLDLVDTKTDVYAFGVLAYYLMMGEFPQGVFDLPSEKLPHYKQGDWDFLICSCLRANPDKRPNLLIELLKKVTSASLGSSAYQERSKFQQRAGEVACEQAAFLASVEPPQVSEPAEEIANVALGSQEVEQVVEGALQQVQESQSERSQAYLQQLQKQVVEAKVSQQIKPEPLKPVLNTQKIERPEYDPDPAQALQVNSTVSHYHPEPKKVENVEPIQTDMVVVKGGQFQRGSHDGNRDEMPGHAIYLPSFAIDIHPVTNEQFVRFLLAMGGEKDGNNQDIIRLRESRLRRSGGNLSIESGYSKHPVVGVTWYGAVAYAKWVGKRLPLESEWEVASRAGISGAVYPTGEEIEKSQANFFSSDTTAVMSYAPNRYGIYDMAGNVYEWCQDWYGYNYYEVSAQEPDNPKGPLQGVYRVLRGGCWKSLKEDLRCSHRNRNNPGTVNRTYGFRCVTDVE